MTTQTAGLGEAIRAWRNRLSPAELGLPAARGRRATGLRREELADLAGVSVDYVVRIEQGRVTTPSGQVAASLARALKLTTAERNHLFRLASLVPPADDEISEHIPPGLQRMLTRLSDSAAAVFAADWQLIWWNRNWTALLGDPSALPPTARNFARYLFPTADDGPRLSPWSFVATDPAGAQAAVASDLRRSTGLFPRDRRLAKLIRELVEGNEDFAALWATGAVGVHREEHRVVRHPTVGPIEVDCDVLTNGDAELKVMVLSAAADTEEATKLRLAMVAGAVT